MVNSKKRIYNYMDKLFLGDGYIGGVCDGLGKWSGIPKLEMKCHLSKMKQLLILLNNLNQKVIKVRDSKNEKIIYN